MIIFFSKLNNVKSQFISETKSNSKSGFKYQLGKLTLKYEFEI